MAIQTRLEGESTPGSNERTGASRCSLKGALLAEAGAELARYGVSPLHPFANAWTKEQVLLDQSRSCIIT